MTQESTYAIVAYLNNGKEIRIASGMGMDEARKELRALATRLSLSGTRFIEAEDDMLVNVTNIAYVAIW